MNISMILAGLLGFTRSFFLVRTAPATRPAALPQPGPAGLGQLLSHRCLAAGPRESGPVQGHRHQCICRAVAGAHRAAAVSPRESGDAGHLRTERAGSQAQRPADHRRLDRGDEPDNAQPLEDDRGYGPPIPPARIVEDYHAIPQARFHPAGFSESGPGCRVGRFVWPGRSHPAPRTMPNTRREVTCSPSTSTR